MTIDSPFEFCAFDANDWSAFAGCTRFENGSQPVSCPIYVLMEDENGTACEAYDAVVIIDQPDKTDRPGDWPTQTTGELYHVSVHFTDEHISKELDGGCFLYTCDASWFTPMQFARKMEALFLRMADDADADDMILVTSSKLLSLGFHFTK
jgi:hypothetical protein